MLLVAFNVYAGSYLCLLDPFDLESSSGHNTHHFLIPLYRVEAPFIHELFAPAVWLDQRVRPKYWNWLENHPYSPSEFFGPIIVPP